MVSPNRIQPLTAERIVNVPVPMVSEEHVDITKVSSQNRVQNRFKEQGVGRECIRSVVRGVSEVFFLMYIDRDSPTMSWERCGFSLKWMQSLLRVESLGREQVGLKVPRRRVASLCPNVVFLRGGGFSPICAAEAAPRVLTVWHCNQCNVCHDATDTKYNKAEEVTKTQSKTTGPPVSGARLQCAQRGR